MVKVFAAKWGTLEKIEFRLKIISVFERKDHHPDPKTQGVDKNRQKETKKYVTDKKKMHITFILALIHVVLNKEF